MINAANPDIIFVFRIEFFPVCDALKREARGVNVRFFFIEPYTDLR